MRHIHPCEGRSAVRTASYKIRKNAKQKKKKNPDPTTRRVSSHRGVVPVPPGRGSLPAKQSHQFCRAPGNVPAIPGGRTPLSETALQSRSGLGAGKAAKRCKALLKSSERAGEILGSCCCETKAGECGPENSGVQGSDRGPGRAASPASGEGEHKTGLGLSPQGCCPILLLLWPFLFFVCECQLLINCHPRETALG